MYCCRYLFLFSITFCYTFNVCISFAQGTKKYNLDNITEKALEYDFESRIQRLSILNVERDIDISKKARLPNLTSNVSNRVNQGRSIDPYTNIYTTKSIYTNSASLNSYLTLFKGNQVNLYVKNWKNVSDFSKLNLEEQKKVVREEILDAYIILNESVEIIELLKERMIQTENEIKRNQLLLNTGNINESVISELQSEKIIVENDLLECNYRLEIALLRIATLIGEKNISVEEFDKINIESIKSEISNNNFLVENTISYKKSILDIKKNKYNVKIVKADLYPTVSLQAGLFSGYSNGRFIVNPVTNQNELYPFTQQFRDNFSNYIILNIDIPIFNRFKTTLSIQKASTEYQISELRKEKVVLEQTALLIEEEKKIKLEYEKYILTQQRITETNNSYNHAKEKFEAGRLTTFEYLIQKNQLFLVKHLEIKSKFSYFLALQLHKIHFSENSVTLIK